MNPRSSPKSQKSGGTLADVADGSGSAASLDQSVISVIDLDTRSAHRIAR